MGNYVDKNRRRGGRNVVLKVGLEDEGQRRKDEGGRDSKTSQMEEAEGNNICGEKHIGQSVGERGERERDREEERKRDGWGWMYMRRMGLEVRCEVSMGRINMVGSR